MSEELKREEAASQVATEAVTAEEDAASSKAERASGGNGSASKRLHRLLRVRTLVTTVVFCAIVVGLIVSGGWGTICSFGLTEVAYLCPVGALEAFAAEHTIIPRLLIALVAVLLAAVLLGRFFCGWICPVPPLQRLFGRSPKTKRSNAKDATAADADGKDPSEESAKPTSSACSHGGCASCRSAHALAPVGGARNGLQIDSRHGVLLGAVASAAVFGFPVFCLICPVGLSIAFVVGIYRAIFEQNPTVSLLIFAAIILVEVVFFRKWCHRFCPIGALLSLVGVRSLLLKPRVDKEKCLRERGIDCRVCVDVCPEELDPHSRRLSECTRCGACIDACPAAAIGFKGSRREKAELPAVAVEGNVVATAVASEEE